MRVYLRAGGCVQGVGYRYFIYYTAQRLGLTGWVRNRGDGDVDMEAQGAPEAVAEFIETAGRGSRYAEVRSLERTGLEDIPERGFRVEDDF